MSKGTVNKVILIGRLGTDPELRQAGGSQVANFTLATNDVWKDKGGNNQERTEWHRIFAWSKQAELANQYLSKGSRVYIEGALQTRQWEKDGEKRYTTEVKVLNIQFLDSKGDKQAEPAGADDSSDLPF